MNEILCVHIRKEKPDRIGVVGKPTFHIWSLAAAFIIATMLRFWDVGDAILLDDEFHTLNAALGAPIKYLVTHFGEADYCIPLALGYKLLHSLTGLSEWVVRLPILLSSMCFCAIVPFLVYPAIRTSALGWIIAIAPFHIFYSRYARPYGIAFLLGLLAVLTTWRLLRSGDRRWLCVAVPCAILAPWFHLTFLPPLVAVGTVVSACALSAHWRPVRTAWFAALCIVLFGWCLLIGPPLIVDIGALSSKSSLDTVSMGTLSTMLELITGMRNSAHGLLFMAAAMAGLCILCRREPWLALLLILAGGTQFAIVLITHPAYRAEGVVLARYTLFCYAFYLLALAAGAQWAVEACTAWRTRYAAAILLALLGVSMVLAGPLPRLMQMPAEWRHHCRFQYGYAWAEDGGLDRFTTQFSPTEWSPFYTMLRELPPGEVTLLEAPWHYEYWRNPLPFYQEYHRQHTAIAFVGNIAGHKRNGELPLNQIRHGFRHFEQLGNVMFNQDARALFLVIHKSWPTELPQITSLLGDSEDMQQVLVYCRTRFGHPWYEDATLTVFRLTKEMPTQTQPSIEHTKQ